MKFFAELCFFSTFAAGVAAFLSRDIAVTIFVTGFITILVIVIRAGKKV